MMELLTRQAAVQPATFNADKRSVEVIFSTGAAVQRRDFEGPFMERLAIDAAAVNLDELRGGPVLAAHNRFDLNGVLGVVESARIEGGQALATLRFSSRSEVAGVVADVQSGILRHVSVGYRVDERKVEKGPNGVRTVTATRWTPREISLVPLAADPGAKVRGDTNVETQQTQEPAVREIGQLAGMTADAIDGMVSRGLTEEQARTEAFSFLKKKSSSSEPTIRTATADPIGYDNPQFKVRAMADALMLRMDGAHKVSDQARPFVGRRLADLARECLTLRSIEVLGMNDARLIERALHSTSDFPELLSEAANKQLQAQYAAAPAGVRRVARKATIADFRKRNVLHLGEAPTLEKVNQNGEFKRGSIGESKESYGLETFGRIFGISRQSLVNDDLGAFSDAARLFGSQAAQFEAQFLVDLLTTAAGVGPTLSDSVALFHTDHGNVSGSGAAIAVATLTAGRKAMRLQKGLDGVTPIDAAPRYLLVPATAETTAEQTLAQLSPSTVEEVNPFTGKLELVVDPRLDAKSTTRWYIFADPTVLPVLEYAYLTGEEGLQTQTRAGFDVDGLEIKARLDFGAGVIDYRGTYTNAGA